MHRAELNLTGAKPKIVGSFGNSSSIKQITAGEAMASCDLVEIRLDILTEEGSEIDRQLWAHLGGVPVLFTARRKDEGSPANLAASARSALLLETLDQAAMIDVEVASIKEMSDVLAAAKRLRVPWVASFHDFEKLPSDKDLRAAAKAAKEAGADVFKVAAMLLGRSDLVRLGDFQSADHGLPVASMGMGPLAAVSRLLCAQSGSILNYGYLGETPTAPGQWSAEFLKLAVEKLEISGSNKI